ncbi:MAG: hypothetical protein V9G04_03665 [Nocardioides sp.]|jgi:hypothetical protein
MDWTRAAEAAQAYLDEHAPECRVTADPTQILTNGQLFTFRREPEPIDDTVLVVHADGHAEIVTVFPPGSPLPFDGLAPVAEPEPEYLGYTGPLIVTKA